MRNVILALAIVGSVGAQAAKVLSVTSNQEQVTVSYETAGRAWKLNDDVCLYNSNRELICGYVGRMTSDSLTVAVTTRQERVVSGQKVLLTRGPRTPASLQSDAPDDRAAEKAAFKVRDPKLLDVAIGLNAGLKYFYPTLTVQIAAFRTVSIGVQGVYAKFQTSGVDVTALGAFALISYYHTHFPFRGLVFQGGVGFFNNKLDDGVRSETQKPLAAQAQVQWRGKAHFALPVDLGVGLGILWVKEIENPVITTKFSGIQPLVNAFVGYSF